jgi:hypothetical protein
MFGYSYRTDDGVVGKVMPPIYPDGSLDKEAAVRDLIQRVLSQLEVAIREHPEEWHLSAPIWQLAQERLAREKLG